jgi:hypothetical protein
VLRSTRQSTPAYVGAVKKAALALVVPLLFLLPACASKGGDAKTAAAESDTFKFSPRLGSKFRHVMTRAQELTIVGTPLRQMEEWKLTWDIELSAEQDAVLMRATMASLALSVNGAEVLRGDEVTSKQAFVEILVDSSGKVIDVRRTQTLTDAIVSVARPEAAEVVRAVFHPEALRYHFAGLVAERLADLTGRPAKVGSSWQIDAAPDAPGAATRTLRVTAAEACGAFNCVKVASETKIAPEVVWESAKAQVANYVSSRGGDPAAVQLGNAEVELVDEVLVEPATLQFHGATFSQAATITVQAPEGQLTVKSSLKRTSTYEF